MLQEPTRQIHLDFHTSEHLPAIGSAFRKEQFQDALRTGKVNLINVFAKCHHSWSYYPTQVGTPHPNLHGDLLGQQIAACHEIGVKAPIYYTVGWSAHDAEEHPSWCVRDAEGDTVAPNWPPSAQPEDAKPTFQWKELCVNTEYHQLIADQTEEICKRFDVDGLWYDIYHPQIPCYCDSCRVGMERLGIDVDDTRAVEGYRANAILRHANELQRIIRSYHPEASIYFNGLTAIERPQNFTYRLHQYNTKNDLEDLPTTWGGYDKFPLRAKLFHREQKPIVAMSGKFHTAWGEFGGFKSPEALRFEAAAMIAFGARCNFGDHLHPLGLMDATTYKNIGVAYDYVERIEAYGIDGLPVSTVGFWASNELEADEGLARMLLELQIDFDVAAPGDDLSKFDILLVPSRQGVLDGAVDEIRDYLEAGGSLVLLGKSVLDSSGALQDLPLSAELVGEPRFDIDYTQVSEALSVGTHTGRRADGVETNGLRADALPATPFLNYRAALRFQLEEPARELAGIQEPYFSRTYGHYCGHQNTPNNPVRTGPALWRAGNTMVFAHDVDRMYYTDGAKVHRDLLAGALNALPFEPMVEAALPSAGRVSLLHQSQHHRYVAHLLYGAPIERGRCVVIEDLPELRESAVTLRLPYEPSRIYRIPDGDELPFTVSQATGRRNLFEVSTTLPSFSCHAAIVAEYES